MACDLLRKRLSRWIAALALIAAGYGMLLLPARRALRGRRPMLLNGIATLDDAVAACRRSGLDGWDLVAYAQHLVYRKFTFYSCRNLWDTPAGAFRRGMGYCTQYNLALKQILDRLGFDARAVFSLRVRVADDPDWTMGHTWLRVRVGGWGDPRRLRRACRQPARPGQFQRRWRRFGRGTTSSWPSPTSAWSASAASWSGGRCSPAGRCRDGCSRNVSMDLCLRKS